MEPLVKVTLWSKGPSGQRNLWSKEPSGQKTSGQWDSGQKNSGQKYPLVNGTLVKGSTPLSKHSFYARKQAFNIHSQVCDALDCSTCSCAKKVHHLKFDPGNFSKYMYSEYPQITLKNKSMNKKVTFVDNTTPEKSEFKKFHLSKKLVEMACEHCVSFTEINLLCAI